MDGNLENVEPYLIDIGLFQGQHQQGAEKASQVAKRKARNSVSST